MSQRRKRLALACVLALELVQGSRRAYKRRREHHCYYDDESESESSQSSIDSESECEAFDEEWLDPEFYSVSGETDDGTPQADCDAKSDVTGNTSKSSRSRNPPAKRRIWAKVYLSKEDFMSIEERLLMELVADCGEGDYKNVCRLTPEKFYDILEKVEPFIARRDTMMRCAVPAKFRLALTLKFIFSGDTFISLSRATGVSAATLGKMIPNVMDAIVRFIRPECLKTPQTSEDWLEVSNGFQQKTAFPHVLGSLEALCIKTLTRKQSDNDIAIIIAIDSNYRIIYEEIIDTALTSESTIHQTSVLINALQDSTLNIPQPECFDNDLEAIPYYFLSNNSFRVSDNILVPYDQEDADSAIVFNRKIEEVTSTSKIAMSILTNRFRSLSRTLNTHPDNLRHIFETVSTLYNYLLDTSEVVETLDVEMSDTFRYLKLEMEDNHSACVLRDRVAEHLLEVDNR